MSDKYKFSKDTDRDVKPTRGQESNENWDDTGEKEPDTNAGESKVRKDEETNTTGYGSSQKTQHGRVENPGPLDADFDELPSQKWSDRHSGSAGQGIE